ncbi:hypothetical protein VQP54_08920 [Ruoffia tabacinasalis]|nr:hypothetical protein [Ruoffia tabacinasalis]
MNSINIWVKQIVRQDLNYIKVVRANLSQIGLLRLLGDKVTDEIVLSEGETESHPYYSP